MGIEGEDGLFQTLLVDLHLERIIDKDGLEAISKVEGRGSDNRGGESGELEVMVAKVGKEDAEDLEVAAGVGKDVLINMEAKDAALVDRDAKEGGEGEWCRI